MFLHSFHYVNVHKVANGTHVLQFCRTLEPDDLSTASVICRAPTSHDFHTHPAIWISFFTLHKFFFFRHKDSNGSFVFFAFSFRRTTETPKKSFVQHKARQSCIEDSACETINHWVKSCTISIRHCRRRRCWASEWTSDRRRRALPRSLTRSSRWQIPSNTHTHQWHHKPPPFHHQSMSHQW